VRCPRRRRTKALQTDPTLKFEFYLAQKLSRTVAELRQMSGEEFTYWGVYYGIQAQEQQLARGGAG
jgi:hypothetical protein